MKKTILIILLTLIMLPLMGQAKKVVRVTAEHANIRQEASTESTILLGVTKDTRLILLGKNGNWLRVELPGGKSAGYIHSSLGVVEDAPAEVIVKTEVDKKAAPPPEKKAKEKASPKPAPKLRKSRPSMKRSSDFKKMYIGAFYGISTQEESQTVGFTTPIYFEDAAFNTVYTAEKGKGFSALFGYRLSPALSVELGADITSRNLGTLTTFAIPHPLWPGIQRGGEHSQTGSLKENSIFLNIAYKLNFSSFYVTLSAGPCMVMAQADLIDDLTLTESAYPFETASVTPVMVQKKQNIFGFNGGAALGYAFTDSISLLVNFRFISAKMKIEGDDVGMLYPAEIILGGLRLGGGIQISF